MYGEVVELENVPDVALSAVAEGALLGHARRGGDVVSLYDLLVQTLEEWHLGRVTRVTSAFVSESFGDRYAVVKLRTRENSAKLEFFHLLDGEVPSHNQKPRGKLRDGG
ncbi:hypothetical protein PsorP6_012958 [Peronosclerospora sorghi]|uniref:Uncharacterized protein n=1 Tax=Peronosclerospora sorghi TaxID=230839 RepID=A0ACC0WIW1_9STRA|nr:hypothetical protein PsorP6_012958 [Peronosclerospora sorghi]